MPSSSISSEYSTAGELMDAEEEGKNDDEDYVPSTSKEDEDDDSEPSPSTKLRSKKATLKDDGDTDCKDDDDFEPAKRRRTRKLIQDISESDEGGEPSEPARRGRKSKKLTLEDEDFGPTSAIKGRRKKSKKSQQKDKKDKVDSDENETASKKSDELIQQMRKDDPEFELVCTGLKEKCCVEGCFQKLDPISVYQNRQAMKMMDKSYRNAFVHGQINCLANTIPNKSRIIGPKSKRITKYYFDGKQICGVAYSYIYALHRNTYLRFLQHVKNNGLKQVEHGNKGKGRHLPEVSTRQVIAFLKNKAETIGVKSAPAPPKPQPVADLPEDPSAEGDAPKSKKRKPKREQPALTIITLPVNVSKQSLYREYKGNLPDGAKPVSWASFLNIWNRVLPNMKVRKPKPVPPKPKPQPPSLQAPTPQARLPLAPPPPPPTVILPPPESSFPLMRPQVSYQPQPQYQQQNTNSATYNIYYLQ